MEYRSLKHWKYELLKDTECDVKLPPSTGNEYVFIALKTNQVMGATVLKVKARYAWDGASFIARDTPNIMRASLFHDALCQLISEGLLNKKYRKYADQLLRKIALEDGMSKFRANYVYFAVRLYSKLKGM